MILDILTRWFMHIERRHPPPGFNVEVVDFDMDAGRLAARYEADQRRRPPSDPWLRQGGSEDQHSHPFAG
jgi:hypothetical protein